MLKVAIIGLGRFGMALARHLGVAGVEIIAIDRQPHLVNEIKDDVDIAVRLDSTDRHSLLAQDIDKVDVCVISIGENFEAALLTTAIVKQMGVPMIICRAQTQTHAEIFEKMGANRVIQPEFEAGVNLARQLANPHLVDFIRLAEGFTLIEFQAPKEFHNKTIRNLELRNRYNVNLVVIKRAEVQADQPDAPPVSRVFVPDADDVIVKDDILVVVGSDVALSRLPRE